MQDADIWGIVSGLRGYLPRMQPADAEDILQDTALGLLEAHRAGRIEKPEAVKYYALSILKRATWGRWRGPRFVDELREQMYASQPHIEQWIDRKRQRAFVDQRIATCKPAQRAVLERALAGDTAREMCATLGITQSEQRNRQYEGIAKVRKDAQRAFRSTNPILPV